MTKDLYPNRRAEDHQYYCGNQPQPATHHRATRGQFRPVHRKQNDREVTARRDGKRQPHHKGDVLILKQHAEDNGNHTQNQHGDFRYPQFFTFGRAFLKTLAYRSCETADAPANVRPATTARMVAKATAEIKPRNRLPPTAFAVNGRHVVTTNQMARRVFIFRIRTNQHDRAEADNKGQNIEVAHKSGGVEHALTCFAGIADCKEAHQNVRQARRTKHQSQTQRARRSDLSPARPAS